MSASKEVNEAVGQKPDEADAEIDGLKRELAEPSAREVKQQRLAALEAERGAKRSAQFTAVAEKRRIGIRRALGSVKDQLEQDERRYVAAVEAVAAARATWNARYEQAEALLAEDGAIADRFGLAPSDLARATAPAVGKDAIAALATLYGGGLVERTDRYRPATEQDETGLRQRRTYAEVAGSPGHALISEAGLADFPPFTERQRAMLAEREANRTRLTAQAQKDADTLAAEAARAEQRRALG